jgi:hypothetical protein
MFTEFFAGVDNARQKLKFTTNITQSAPPALRVRALIKGVSYRFETNEPCNTRNILRIDREFGVRLVCSDDVFEILGPAFARLCEDGFIPPEHDYENRDGFDCSPMSESNLLAIALRKSVFDWLANDWYADTRPQIIACEQITQAEADSAPPYGFAELGPPSSRENSRVQPTWAEHFRRGSNPAAGRISWGGLIRRSWRSAQKMRHAFQVARRCAPGFLAGVRN